MLWEGAGVQVVLAVRLGPPRHTVEAKGKGGIECKDSIGVWRLPDVARSIKYLFVPRCSGVEET